MKKNNQVYKSFGNINQSTLNLDGNYKFICRDNLEKEISFYCRGKFYEGILKAVLFDYFQIQISDLTYRQFRIAEIYKIKIEENYL